MNRSGAGKQATIPAERAIGIAQADASNVYGDLTFYRIGVSLESGGWHVDYELKEPGMKGGGPHYVIDSTSGRIINKRYEQ